MIFAQSIGQIADIYQFIKGTLGINAYVDEMVCLENRLISMYHGQISEDLQKFTLQDFPKIGCNLRVLVCTIAFGMGVEIPDIKQVIHWGKSKSILSHWQEVGRCGRDGSRCRAVWYPKSTAGDDKDVFELIKRDESCCVREVILKAFCIDGVKFPTFVTSADRLPCSSKCVSCECELCLCCSHCRKRCGCSSSM